MGRRCRRPLLGHCPSGQTGCRVHRRRTMTDRSVARTVGQSSCGSGHHPPAVPTKNLIRTVRVTDRRGLEPANESQRKDRRPALRGIDGGRGLPAPAVRDGRQAAWRW